MTEVRLNKNLAGKRTWFFSVTLLIAAVATLVMADLLWRVGFDQYKILFLIIYFILFFQATLGAMHALYGLFRGVRLSQSTHITATLDLPKDASLLEHTAIIIPIYNEDVNRVYQGLRTLFLSLKKSSNMKYFDFYILSDSTNPDIWVEEESSWSEMCEELKAFGHIFYRRRQLNLYKKAGNIAEFCKDWGGRYKYMVVLDADSIMSGDCVTRLVNLMEKNPEVGICQTAPQLVRGQTLYARLSQFASSLYGPVFQAGLNYWQQGEGNYWGHNAIIRVEPFVQHCDLPDLPGSGPLGGKILSHDFVEAALMRKAGWQNWLAYDLPDSYEEPPPDIIAAAARDRRWCQGNLQHAWLVFSRGIATANRIHMLNGIMGYAGAALWFVLLILGTYFISWQQLSGMSPIIVPSFSDFIQITFVEQSIILLGFTLLILFMPKLCGLFNVLFSKEQSQRYGGRICVFFSVCLEAIITTVLAPIMMLYYTQFVFFTLLGSRTGWGNQRRGADGELRFRDAVYGHAVHTILGIIWSICSIWSSWVFFAWMSPILVGMVFSIPISYLLAKKRCGDFFKRFRLFLVPSESAPSDILLELQNSLDNHSFKYYRVLMQNSYNGLFHVILDPYINAIHVTLLRENLQNNRIVTEPVSSATIEHLLAVGPSMMQKDELLNIMHNPDALERLHNSVWTLAPERIADDWRRAAYRFIPRAL